MDLVVYDDDEKRYVPWAVALGAALLLALLVAVLTFFLARQASGDEGEQPVRGVSSGEPATRPSEAPSAASPSSTAAPAAAPACEAALQGADAVLERSVAVDEALAEHTGIMDELLAERITADQALDRTLPVLTDGATERRRLEEAIAAYRASREECSS